MKRNIQSYIAILCVAAGSFIACSQEDEPNVCKTSENESEEYSTTRGSNPVVCTIKTDALGQVQGKVEDFVKGGGTAVVENITNLYIEGPINQTDIDYIKNLQYLDSLSLEKAEVYDAEGKRTNLLAERSFYEMKSESAVYLPESINRMGLSCFESANIRAIYMQNVKELVEVGLNWYPPYDNEYYEYYPPTGEQFYNCKKLQKVVLSDQLVKISGYAFAYCSSLKKLELPNVKEIGQGAFMESGIEELEATDYLVTVGIQAFRSCVNLKKVKSNKSLKKVDHFAFRGCTALTEFSQSDLKELGKYALADCSSLKQLDWPTEITEIPEGLFSGCEKLKFTIPETITSLGSYAFNGCKAITEMTIPASVEKFGDGIFAYSGLSSFVNGIDWIPDHFYQGCAGFTEVTIPESMPSVGIGAFQDCPNITSVTIKGSTIGENAFRNCQALNQVSIEKCEYIGARAFRENQALKRVSIIECGNVGSEAFCENYALKEVSIMDCGDIGAKAFYYDNAMTELYVKKCATIGSHAFDECDVLQLATIDECGDLLYRALASCDLLKQLVIGKCKNIGDCAIHHCRILQDVTIGECTGISSRAFWECFELRQITIPSTVETAENDIFLSCTNLRYVDWKSTQTTIPCLNSYNNNPNLLIFAPAGVTSDSRNRNVIIDGKATRINITQGLFDCPRSFTADEVVFEIDFGADRWKSTETGTGVAARWNAIAVPFTVTSIKSANKGALAPFGSDAVNEGKAKPFWLCEMTSEGFKDATTIEANKPYILAMPNNPNYVDEYNIQDIVTFTGTNATFAPSSEQQASSPTGPAGWALTPLYHDSSDAQLMAMNWDAFTDNKNTWHPVGNCFRLNARTANAFEAVITSSSSSSAAVRNGYIPLGGATTRNNRQLGRIPQREDMPMP